jgi:hypothetical protein
MIFKEMTWLKCPHVGFQRDKTLLNIEKESFLSGSTGIYYINSEIIMSLPGF